MYPVEVEGTGEIVRVEKVSSEANLRNIETLMVSEDGRQFVASAEGITVREISDEEAEAMGDRAKETLAREAEEPATEPEPEDSTSEGDLDEETLDPDDPDAAEAQV